MEEFKITNGQYAKWLWGDGVKLTMLDASIKHRIIGKASRLSEKQAKEIVYLGSHSMSYNDYVKQTELYPKKDVYITTLDTAVDSLHSLCRSHGIEPENCLILKMK